MDDALKKHARSFYLTLQALPPAVRRPISIAYLIARTADTVADEPALALPPEARTRLLLRLRETIEGPLPLQIDFVERFYRDLAAASPTLAAHELVLALPLAHAELGRLSRLEAESIAKVLRTLLKAMMQDRAMLEVVEREGGTAALHNFTDTDRYAYLAAGCVGEFWAELCWELVPACRRASTLERTIPAAVKYGQALQWTNMLRDVARDLAEGRCYLPEAELTARGITVAELKDAGNFDRLRPLYREFAAHAFHLYREGWEFVNGIPFREMRLRLASAWPALIGLRTLALLVDTDRNPLDPSQRLKITRQEVLDLIVASSSRALLPGKLDRMFETHAVRLEKTGVVAKPFVVSEAARAASFTKI